MCALGYRLSCWFNLHMRKWQPGPGGLQQLGRSPGLGLEEAAVQFYITKQSVVLKIVNPIHPKRDAWEMGFSREYLGFVI